MPKRIDRDGSDPQHEIEEALRQLTQRRQQVDSDRELERAVQEVAEQQEQAAGPDRLATPSRPWGARTAWVGFICVILGLIVAVLIMRHAEPPPPIAKTPEEAVSGFWDCLIKGKYEASTNYWPALQTKYGSAAQAGAQLRETLKTNPPTRVTVGPATLIPNTTQYRVPFEVIKRDGLPSTGEWLVNDTGVPSTGFVIIWGGV